MASKEEAGDHEAHAKGVSALVGIDCSEVETADRIPQYCREFLKVCFWTRAVSQEYLMGVQI
jgi:hypothetical protein